MPMPDREQSGVIFPVLDEHVYVELLWYVAYDDCDLLAMLFREPKTGPWQLRYRFRYYADDQAWDSKDHKSVYNIEAPAEWDKPRDRLVALMDAAITSAAVDVGTPRTTKRLVVKGDGEKAGALIIKQPFSHAKSAGSWRPPNPTRPH